MHGVRREFLEVGDQAKGSNMEGAYFIGKVRAAVRRDMRGGWAGGCGWGPIRPGP